MISERRHVSVATIQGTNAQLRALRDEVQVLKEEKVRDPGVGRIGEVRDGQRFHDI